MAVARWSPIVMFTSSLCISYLWYENFTFSLPGSHAISGGVIVTVFCFCAGKFDYFFANYILFKTLGEL